MWNPFISCCNEIPQLIRHSYTQNHTEIGSAILVVNVTHVFHDTLQFFILTKQYSNSFYTRIESVILSNWPLHVYSCKYGGTYSSLLSPVNVPNNLNRKFAFTIATKRQLDNKRFWKMHQGYLPRNITNFSQITNLITREKYVMNFSVMMLLSSELFPIIW